MTNWFGSSSNVGQDWICRISSGRVLRPTGRDTQAELQLRHIFVRKTGAESRCKEILGRRITARLEAIHTQRIIFPRVLNLFDSVPCSPH